MGHVPEVTRPEQGLLRPGKEAVSGPRGRDFPSYEDGSQTTRSLASGPQRPFHRPETLKLAGDHLLLTLPVGALQQFLRRPQSSKTPGRWRSQGAWN